jgi:anti-sigma B factor antagonist
VELTERVEGSGKILRVDGEVDLSTAGRFRAAIDRLAAAGGARLVVDLRGCAYIDSTGLAALLHGSGRTGGFAIVARDGAPREILHATAIDQTIPVFETVEQALESALQTS